jgi:hypothetical protein
MGIFKEITNKKHLRQAARQAYNERQSDPYVDLLELNAVGQAPRKFIKKVHRRLKEYEKYIPMQSYAYFKPKTSLVYRKMVYLPFEELVFRYAVFGAIGERIDPKLSPRCFANRLAKPKRRKEHLLQDYAAESWPAFCAWQSRCAEKYGVLVRTDISSFYDSVSHDGLTDALARELGVSEDDPLIRLVGKMLDIPVVSFSHSDGRPEHNTMHQGIPTGSNLEGLVANIYLKSVDGAMDDIEGVEFGRYNDDMRIFASDRETAIRALMVLQEKLASLGLNLGAAKTEIAVGIDEMDRLRSKLLEVSGIPLEPRRRKKKAKGLEAYLDRGFDRSDPEFDPKAKIRSDSDAKRFCAYLSHRTENGKPSFPLSEWDRKTVARLVKIVLDHRSSVKHAAWLLVYATYKSGIRPAVRRYARKKVVQLIQSEAVDPYARYRLLHHIVRRDYLLEGYGDRIVPALPSLLSSPSFETIHIAIYLMHRMGKKPKAIGKLVEKHVPFYRETPVADALKRIGKIAKAQNRSRA